MPVMSAWVSERIECEQVVAVVSRLMRGQFAEYHENLRRNVETPG
jgi:hypothetical protein